MKRADVEEMFARLEARDPHPETERRAPWSAAAMIALALVAGTWWWQRPGPMQEVAYQAIDAQRSIQPLAGATVTLMRGSRLTVGVDKTLALMGSAYFDVHHDPARPLTVHVAGYALADIGTRFDVDSAGGIVRVAVAQGEVSLSSPTGESAVVRTGQAALGDASGSLRIVPAASTATGAWREGAFVYDRVPLALVAADIARFTGKPVSVAGIAAQRDFSGVLARGNRDAMVASLRDLAGVSVKREGDAIILGSGAGH